MDAQQIGVTAPPRGARLSRRALVGAGASTLSAAAMIGRGPQSRSAIAGSGTAAQSGTPAGDDATPPPGGTPTAPATQVALRLFADELHQEFAEWALSYAPYSGCDIGDVLAIAGNVEDGDDGSYYEAWAGFADRLAAEADAAAAGGHRSSARDGYLHASAYYGVALHPLYGTPVDLRLVAAFRKQMATFAKAMALSDPPGEPVDIPFDGHAMQAYFIPTAGHAGERRPLVIGTNGYDAAIPDMYLAFGAAATAHGYHCLLFDGPGQGRMLIEDGVPLRPDWETVVRPVVDYALTRADVDPDRIALEGWSLGGYLAPRAASGEHRLAACIADPGWVGPGGALQGLGLGLGLSPEAAAALPAADDATLRQLTEAVNGNRSLHWEVVQRGYWVNGVSTMAEFLQSLAQFTMAGRAQNIRCPTLLTAAEFDPLSQTTQALVDELTSPKALIRFTGAEGAGLHVEFLNRSLANRRMFDWLDGVFG